MAWVPPSTKRMDFQSCGIDDTTSWSNDETGESCVNRFMKEVKFATACESHLMEELVWLR